MRRFHWGMAGREARWNLQTGFTIWKAFESAALTDALSSMMTKDDIFFHFNDDKTTLPYCHNATCKCDKATCKCHKAT